MKQEKYFFQLFILFLFVTFFVPLSAEADTDSCKSMSWIPLLLSNSTVTVTFSGKASIPNYTPAGQLWVVVDGYDGNRYGVGPSDAAGNFSIQAAIPKDAQTVILYAVDPDNPDAYVKAYIDLDGTFGGQAQPHLPGLKYSRSSQIFNEIETINLSDHFSKAMIRDLTGHKPIEFTADELAALEELENAMNQEGYSPRLTTVVINSSLADQFSDLVKEISAPVIRRILDGYANGPGDLITRVRRAQQYVTAQVLPANRVDTYSWLLATRNVEGIGNSVTHILDFGARRMYIDWFGGIPAEYAAEINYDDLESDASIITNPGGAGAGNCEENGLVAAYLASRFCEFKQIVRLGVEVPSFYIPGTTTKHAFAIACEKSFEDSGFDLYDELPKVYAPDTWPEKLFTSDCMLIDPWADVTLPITKDLVLNQQQWKFPHGVLKVKLPADHCNSAPDESFSVQGKPILSINTCPVNSPCENCSIAEEVSAVLIEPFEIPTATDDYVVWYMDNVRCWDAPRIYATHRSGFNLEELTCNIPGGGIDCSILVEKKVYGAGFRTLEDAEDWFCSQITKNWYHYWCNSRGPRVETGGGGLWTLQIPCDLSKVPYVYP